MGSAPDAIDPVGDCLQVLGVKSVALEAAVGELRRVGGCWAAALGFKSFGENPC